MAKNDAHLPARQGAAADADAGMVLALDIGNTETRIGLFDLGAPAAAADATGAANSASAATTTSASDVASEASEARNAASLAPKAAWSLTTPAALTADEALLALEGVFGMLPEGRPACAGAIVSCVVPALTDAWCAAARTACGGARVLVVGPGLKTGLPMDYRDPAEVGPDRIADMMAARERYGAPAIVIDMGTTTNFTVLDREGSFAGGIIAAGMRLSARMLPEHAARLSMMEVRAPRSVIGKSTREAMQAGVVLGEAARTDGLINMIWDELGYTTPLIATGADAHGIAALSRHEVEVDPDLTLRGLALLYQANRAKKK